MEKLSIKKRLNVARLYLSGLSHQEIAAKTGISVGSVSSIVTELKAGGFPEVGDLADQIEILRDLSLELKHANLAPGQSSIGLAVLKRIHECGLDVADIDRWADILKLAGTEDKTKAFVDTVYRIQDFINQSGLSLDEIDAKVDDLETKAAELQPTLDEVNEKKQEIAGLEKKRDDLAPVVDNLDKNYKLLNPIVNDLQKRQGDLLKQIHQEESITASTQEALATWSKENQKLAKAGFSLEALAEFNDRSRVIAARHHLAVSGLRGRLLHELEILGKGLGLETKIKATSADLQKERKAVTLAKKEQTEFWAANETLREQKAGLEAGIKATRDTVIKEIDRIASAAKDMLNRFNGELQRGDDEVLGIVRHLKDEAIETGREIGRYEGIIEANQWLVDVIALSRGEDVLESMRVRVILLMLLRGAQPWMKCNMVKVEAASGLPSAVDLLVMELERWRV